LPLPQQVDLSSIPDSLKKARKATVETAKDSGQYLLMPEQYEFLEEAMGQAGGEHIITPLPDEKPEAGDAYSKSRLDTIADRLKLLGFLDRNAPDDPEWVVLESAVRRFQRAAFGEDRLVRDGWVGKQTWGALQELVSFEEPSNLARWMTDGRPCPALKRALHLRLFALGMADAPPGLSITPGSIDAGLRQLAAVAGEFGWEDFHLKTSLAEIDLRTLELIFDQDALVVRLAVKKSVKNKLIIRPFVIAMAKIELWLAGYEIKPDGYGMDARVMVEGKGIDLEDDNPLYIKLVEYWEGLGKDGRSSPKTKAKVFVKSSFQSFFAGIHAMLAEQEDGIPDGDALFDLLSEQAESDGKATILQKVWDHVYMIGARMWDGIKRAWRWFKAMVKKAMEKAKEFATNLARIAYQYIRRAYEGMRAVIKGVCGSISFFTQRVLVFPPKVFGALGEGGLLVGRDKDFDFRALVDVDAVSGNVDAMSGYLASKAEVFGMSCRFLSSLLNILLGLLRKVWFAGWAGLLMALLKLYRSFSHWAPRFIEMQRQEDGYEVNA